MSHELESSLTTPVTPPERVATGLRMHYNQIKMESRPGTSVKVDMIMSGVELYDDGSEGKNLAPAVIRDEYDIDPLVSAEIDPSNTEQMSQVFVVNDPVLGAIQISLGGIYAAVKGYAIEATKERDAAKAALDINTTTE